jgi:hypothetical protein
MQSRQKHTDITSRIESLSRRLMAVDDEADITFTLKEGLEQSGFLIDVFNDPTAGCRVSALFWCWYSSDSFFIDSICILGMFDELFMTL